LNAYLICLRFTQGSTIKRIVQVGRSVLGRVQVGGVAPDGNIPFPLMTKGQRFIRCKGKCFGERAQRHGSKGIDGHRGSMGDMTLVFHHSISINSKGGYFLLFGLVVIDVNP
jgi:hypothetical protein